jgi:hypothetical protein
VQGIGGSKILFTNGGVDPWHALSVLPDANPNPDNSALFIPTGAHCRQMFPSSPNDPAGEGWRALNGRWTVVGAVYAMAALVRVRARRREGGASGGGVHPHQLAVGLSGRRMVWGQRRDALSVHALAAESSPPPP